jgi:NTE family protein
MYIDDLKIGISFSGGGARGIAHIGVLQALLDYKIEPQFVAGASAGSVVGVLYAAGFSPSDILGFIKESSFFKLVKLGFPNGGLTKLSYLKERLSAVISEDDFSTLKRPFWVAITNLNTGKLVVKNEGPLIDIIVASCSIPMVFQAVEIGGEYFVDGGLLCNLPVSPLLSVAEFTIGVNVVPGDPMGSEEMGSVLNVANRSFDLAILANSRPEAALCDFLIEPAGLSNYGVFNFNKYEELYQLGYDRTLDIIPALLEKIDQKSRVIMQNY